MASRALSAPIRAIGYAAQRAGAALTFVGRSFGSGLTLIPSYLAGLLWLINQSFLDLAKEGYRGNSAVYATVRVLSQSAAEPPLIAYTRTPQGEPDQPLPVNHPLMQLIRQPNELQTEFEFWELTTLFLALGGAAHWYKERDNSGHVIGLWPLRPDRVGPIYSTSTTPRQKVLAGWSYLVPGTSHYEAFARADILSFNLPDPAGESGGIVEGWGPLQALAMEVSADNEATRFAGAMVSNYGAPGVVLSTKGSLKSQEDARLIKAGFMRDFGGNRRGMPAVIDADTTITTLGFNLQQLEFPALRSVSESRIAAALGVPAILVGLKTGLEAGIRATIAEQREYFAETTLAAYWRRYSDQYSMDMASEFDDGGDGLVCCFDMTKVRALVAQTLAAQQRTLEAYDRGLLTLNEARAAIGYAARADGDVYATGIAPGRGVQTLTAAGKESSRPVGEDEDK